MTDTDLTLKTQLTIAKPTSEVFEAIVNPESMACYFITSGSGRLDSGMPVVWQWSDCGAELTVTPTDVETDQRVVFLWAASGKETRVAIDLFQIESGETKVQVCESSWPRDDDGIDRCLEQMQGWVHMLCCMKAYLEFGINLRTGSATRAEVE